MASTGAKARRKAEALNRLDDLAVQVAEHFKVEVPDLKVTQQDPELAQIQQLEATNNLLSSILQSAGVGTEEGNAEGSEGTQESPAVEESQEPPVAARKGTTKKAEKKAAKSRRR